MRTTLTLEPDVAAALERRRRERGTGLKEEVNALLRAGLAAREDRQGLDDEYEPPLLNSGERRLDWAQIKELDEEMEMERYLRHVK